MTTFGIPLFPLCTAFPQLTSMVTIFWVGLMDPSPSSVMMLLCIMLCFRITLVSCVNRVPQPLIIFVLEIFTTIISVVLLTSMSLGSPKT